jgi:hypothetical protein
MNKWGRSNSSAIRRDSFYSDPNLSADDRHALLRRHARGKVQDEEFH